MKNRRASRSNSPGGQWCSRTASLQPRFSPDSNSSSSHLQAPPVHPKSIRVQLLQQHSHPHKVVTYHRQHHCLSRWKLCHSLYHSQTWILSMHMLGKPAQQTPILLLKQLPRGATWSSLSLPWELLVPASCPAWLQRWLPRSKLLHSYSRAVLACLHRPLRLAQLLRPVCHTRLFSYLPLHTHQARALPCPAASPPSLVYVLLTHSPS